MEDEKKTYKKGLKGIAVFGGLQVYKILLSVATTKVCAIFLGPYGSGIYGLITSTLTSAEGLVSCGLGTSAVKDIAQAKTSGDSEGITTAYMTLRWLVWITGLIGTLGLMLLSNPISKLIFGTPQYANWFRIASVSILFNQLVSGQGALMTGLQRYKLIARQRLISGLLCAIISLVLYALLKVKGIVPVIVLTALVNYIVSLFVIRGVKLQKVRMSFVDALRNSGPMFKMGISIGLNWTMISLAGFTIRAYISNLSDVATVGLFTASFSLVNTYLGLVFASIESDYYPRLSGSVDNDHDYRMIMVNEMELLIWLLSPLVAILTVFAQPVLAIFYSTKFYGANILIGWSAVSMVARVPGWAMALGIISKGNTILYLRSQLLFIAYQLGMNMVGFTVGGLTGLGISYTISQICYSLQNYYIQRKFYHLSLGKNLCQILFLTLIILCGLCVVKMFCASVFLYTIGSISCVLISLYSVLALNKRMNVIAIIKSRIRR